MTASFRAHSSFNARLNFFVSRSCFRWACMVSGVGASDELLKERPYNYIMSVKSFEWAFMAGRFSAIAVPRNA